MNNSSTLLRIGLVGSCLVAGAVLASPDYPPARWSPDPCAKYYSSGYGHKFYVIHSMEGYYATIFSLINNCNYKVSVHYAANGKKDASTDYEAGDLAQFEYDSVYAWHAKCWNQHSIGTEHEGFVSNPAWFTDSMYQASADLTRSKADKFGFAKDRNHIVAHGEKSNAAWCTWAEANLGIDAHCNTHTDPGPYWDWNKFMSMINVAAPINPPYVFDADSQGWTAGNNMSAMNWTATGWPGIIYNDQVGNDGYNYSPTTSFTGGGIINVSLYPQSGNSASHDMQVFWKTSAENYFDAAKSTPIISYSAQNTWITLNLDASLNSKFVGQTITQMRLDFDNTSKGTRWIVNHVVPLNPVRWWFNANTEGWVLGNGLTGLNWIGSGWPGCIYFDQVGNDAFLYSSTTLFNNASAYKFIGGKNDRIHVRLYPQNGSTTSHNMQVYWVHNGDQTWSESKSSYVTYTGKDQWVDVYIPVGSNPNWWHQQITQLRLDFDNINVGNRWIVDYVVLEHP